MQLPATTSLGLMLKAADDFAAAAHEGQTDKSGRPYIEHPRAVAAMLCDITDKVVALLHDVVEDTPTTLDDLRLWFPEHVVEAVDALTKRRGETLDAYYQRVCANPRARRVKKADVQHNSNPARLARLDEPTRTRLADKYTKAAAAIA